nr:cytochrome c [Ensifer sp. SL37]
MLATLVIKRTRLLSVAAIYLLHSDQSAAADLDRGRAIAAQWCNECHVVTMGQVRGSDTAPPFSEINRTPGLNENRLSEFLSAPEHSRMPNLSLTRSEIADLVAYIKSQQR